MKSSNLKYVILLLMGVMIWLGTRETPPTNFEVAHAGMIFPNFDENNVDCSCGKGTPDSLLSPSSQMANKAIGLNGYETKLFEFILGREYAAAPYGWCRDKKVRATGPYVGGVDYNFHGAARIYYSPRMMFWLTGNPKYMATVAPNKKYKSPIKPRTGEVPDGAMIIKEGLPSPSDFYDQLKTLAESKSKDSAQGVEWYEEVVNDLIWSVSIMVKDSEGSADGWFWSSVSPQALNAKKTMDDYVKESTLSKYDVSAGMNSNFNLPCTRCHGSAIDEMTFSDLTNIDGVSEKDQHKAGVFGKNILHFQTDVSWKDSARIENIEKYRGFTFESAIASFPECIQDSLTVKEFRELFYLPPLMRPWTDNSIVGLNNFVSEHRKEVDPSYKTVTAEQLPFINPGFVVNFPEVKGMTYEKTKKFPFQWADHVVPKPGKDLDHYITSDNCLGCHGGLAGSPYDLTMFIKTGPKYGDGYNISEFGEWRWSPMGLAGRDPIFFSQLESEMKLLEMDAKKNRLHDGLDLTKKEVSNTCLSCHGAMGERQLKHDAKKGKKGSDGKKLVADLKVDYLYLTEAISAEDTMLNSPNYAYHKYGELAREGISCTICHHISPASPAMVKSWADSIQNLTTKATDNWINDKTDKELAYFLFNNNTGQYVESPANELNGPFKDVKQKPMQNVLGISPVHNDFTSDSKMCGTCHTINLPNIGPMAEDYPVLTAAGKASNKALGKYGHSIEQATFLEWQNSAYGFTPDNQKGDDFKSCQNCHMPNSFESLTGDVKINQITTKIATVQDASYAYSPNQLPNDSLTLLPHSDFKRHELVGLNVFLLEMFDQFPGILGVNEKDYMTSATNGNALALENMLLQARDKTVDVEATAESGADQYQLNVNVKVTSKVGHRFPSGVAFRRAFLEVLVMDKATGHVIWGSGRTNDVGVITDECGEPLKTEFMPNHKQYQPHYQVIRHQDQVQIYEELNLNQDSMFTTSFIHRNIPVKDNRFLPKGYHPSGDYKTTTNDRGEVIYEFMRATDPFDMEDDPDYNGVNGYHGQDNTRYIIDLPDGYKTKDVKVKATMYYQAIPPFWLHQRFTLAPDKEATQRLYYMTSHLNLSDTPMKDWKLPLQSAEAEIKVVQ